MERLRREIIRFHAAKINLFDYRFFSFFTFTPIFDFEPVFVSDGYMTAHIKLGNATEVADIRLEEVKKALEHIFNSVQTLSPLARREGFEPSVRFPVHTISNRAP